MVRNMAATICDDGNFHRCFVDEEFHFNLVKALNNLKSHSSLCDITIVCGKERILAHKIVLAATSTYFCAMFTSGLCESTLNEIELKGLETQSVNALINYAYTGVLDIHSQNAQCLLEASDLLQFKTAKDYCSEYIASQIDMSNCLDVYQLADRYSCLYLSNTACNFFKEHFAEITSSEHFLNLNFQSVKQVMQDDDISIKREIDVLNACLLWLEHDPDERMQHKNDLLSCIRFTFIGPMELKNVSSKESFLLPLKKKSFLLKTTKCNRYNSIELRMRKCYKQWLYVFGGERSFLTEINDVECFNHPGGGWELCKPLKGARSSFAAVVIGKKLYVIGGMRRSVKLGSAKCFDAENGKWVTLPPPLKCRGDTKAAELNGMLYVAGGSGDRESACRYLEMYDPHTKTWTRLEKMNNRRRRFNLVAFDGFLYALGGFDDKLGDLSSVEHYDPSANKWTQDSSMLTPRNDFGAAVLSGYIYAVGGANGARGSLDLVEKFNPKENLWTHCACMQNCRGGLSVAVFFGRIVAVTGINIYMSLIETAEYYNEVEDKWHQFPALRIARSGSVAVCLPFRMPSGDNRKSLESGDSDLA